MYDYWSRQNLRMHRRAYSSGFEQNEINHKTYRALLAYFVENINTTVKNYQDCIPDLEEQPKIRVNSQEQKTIENDLKSFYKKMSGKLVKDSNYRNIYIKKTYQEYMKEYEPVAEKLKKEQVAENADEKKKGEKKAHFRLKQAVSVKQSQHSHFLKYFNRINIRRQVATSRAENRSKTQENKSDVVLCRTSQFKAFDSQQLERRQKKECQSLRTKTSSQWYKNPFKRRKGSPILSTCNPESENQEVLIITDDKIINENSCEEQWQLEKYKDMKPVQSFISNRVLAMRNREKATPEMQLSKMGFRPTKKSFCVNSIQSQCYAALSKNRV